VGSSTCDSNSEIWDITYSGNCHHGVLTSFDTTETTIDGVSVSLVGKLLGGFAGTSAQRFIGGINMHVEDDSSRYVSAAYLPGTTTYFTGADINGLNQDQFGMLATSGNSYAIYGGHSQQQGSCQNYLLADYSLAESGWHPAEESCERFRVHRGPGHRRDQQWRVEDRERRNPGYPLLWPCTRQAGGFGAFTSLSVDSANIGGTVTNSDVEGRMAGMLINAGEHVVTSFAFKNVHTGGANEHVAGTLVTEKDDVAVDWGNWNNPTIANLAGALETDANPLFNTLQLTPEFVIQQLEGNWRFVESAGSGYSTGLSAGSFSGVEGQYDVDFDSGDIRNGHLEVTAGTVAKRWDVLFDGTISNDSVTLTADVESLTVTDV
jgi:hypothetical protein